MRTVFSAKKRISTIPESIGVGGTGASSPQAAIEALEGVSNNILDIANGVAVLGSDSLVKPINIPDIIANIKPTVKLGDNNGTVSTGETIECLITNYDSRKTYTLTNVIGVANLFTYDFLINELEDSGIYNYPFDFPLRFPPINGLGVLYKAGTILYTAPSTAGQGGFTLNGIQFNINVIEHVCPQAEIINPTNNDVINISSIYASADILNDSQYGAPTEMHYQLAEDSNFTLNVVDFHTASVDPGYFDSLVENKLYYIRCRGQFRKSVSELVYGPWSTTVSFVTAAVFPLTNVQQLSDSTTIFSDSGFGWSLDLTDDANFLVIGSPESYHSDQGSGSAQGSISVYKRALTNDYDNDIYSGLYYKTTSINGDSYSNLGSQVCISDNNDYIFASDIVGPGKINVYKSTTLSPITWGGLNLVSTIYPVDINEPIVNSINFGKNMAISKEVNGFIYIVVTDDVQGVYVFKYDTSTDTVVDTDSFVYPNINDNPLPHFGSSVSINDNGDRILIGAPTGEIDYVDTVPITCGVACLYQRTGNDWALAHTFIPADYTAANTRIFGAIVRINHSGDEVFISDNGNAEDAIQASLCVFKEVDSNWSLTQRINTHDIVYTPDQDGTVCYPFVISISISGNDNNLSLAIKTFQENIFNGNYNTVSILKKENNSYALRDKFNNYGFSAYPYTYSFALTTSTIDIAGDSKTVVFGGTSNNSHFQNVRIYE